MGAALKRVHTHTPYTRDTMHAYTSETGGDSTMKVSMMKSEFEAEKCTAILGSKTTAKNDLKKLVGDDTTHVNIMLFTGWQRPELAISAFLALRLVLQAFGVPNPWFVLVHVLAFFCAQRWLFGHVQSASRQIWEDCGKLHDEPSSWNCLWGLTGLPNYRCGTEEAHLALLKTQSDNAMGIVATSLTKFRRVLDACQQANRINFVVLLLVVVFDGWFRPDSTGGTSCSSWLPSSVGWAWDAFRATDNSVTPVFVGVLFLSLICLFFFVLMLTSCFTKTDNKPRHSTGDGGTQSNKILWVFITVLGVTFLMMTMYVASGAGSKSCADEEADRDACTKDRDECTQTTITLKATMNSMQGTINGLNYKNGELEASLRNMKSQAAANTGVQTTCQTVFQALNAKNSPACPIHPVSEALVNISKICTAQHEQSYVAATNAANQLVAQQLGTMTTRLSEIAVFWKAHQDATGVVQGVREALQSVATMVLSVVDDNTSHSTASMLDHHARSGTFSGRKHTASCFLGFFSTQVVSHADHTATMDNAKEALASVCVGPSALRTRGSKLHKAALLAIANLKKGTWKLRAVDSTHTKPQGPPPTVTVVPNTGGNTDAAITMQNA